jgi:hypothetical protein
MKPSRFKLLLVALIGAVLVVAAVACAASTPVPSSSGSAGGGSGSGSGTSPANAGNAANAVNSPSTTAPPTSPSTASTLVSSSTSLGKNLLTAGMPCTQAQVGLLATTDSGEQLTCTLRPGSPQPRWMGAF